jgi:transcriptional regulator with XRE-family HTH domain
MSLIATGAYLKRLREEAKLSRLALSKQVNTSDSQIIRIEQGQETRGSLLAMLVKTLNASPDDIIELLVSEKYAESDGISFAELWIEKRKPRDISSQEVHPDILNLISRLTDYELGRWVSLGERIIEERKKCDSISSDLALHLFRCRAFFAP